MWLKVDGHQVTKQRCHHHFHPLTLQSILEFIVFAILVHTITLNVDKILTLKGYFFFKIPDKQWSIVLTVLTLLLERRAEIDFAADGFSATHSTLIIQKVISGGQKRG
jgi:hypothetical protein